MYMKLYLMQTDSRLVSKITPLTWYQHVLWFLTHSQSKHGSDSETCKYLQALRIIFTLVGKHYFIPWQHLSVVLHCIT